MSDDELRSGSRQYEADRSRRIALERELQELQEESERGQQVLDSLDEKIHSLRQEVEQQRRLKPERGCSACRAVTLQVDAAAQSLLGSAGHVARTLLRDPGADRTELLDTVLRYLEPVKHLDPDLEELYERAQASLRFPEAEPSRPAHYRSGGGTSGEGGFPYSRPSHFRTSTRGDPGQSDRGTLPGSTGGMASLGAS